ncbi:MAG: radical SAM protein, partial [Clostridiales bacterium]|nr:radical SAM protein [Clostridiales bacterium]
GKTGGVTISGGEPLLQKESVVRLLDELHARGIHTAVDTGGGIYYPEALARADLVLLDIKHPDAQKFYELTGVKQDALLQTLAYLREHDKKFWVRHVCVPGLTDTAQNVLAVKKMAAGAEKIELLAYHTMGIPKWEKLGLAYPLQGVPPLSATKLQELNEILQKE